MASRKNADSQTNYPKKYWWLILIVVPILIALIQNPPWPVGTSAAGTSNSFTIGDVSIIENQAVPNGATLSEELVQQLTEAVQLSKNKQHGDAASRIERVRAEAGAAATLPALQVSLADEYRLAGKEEDARKTYHAVIQKDSGNQRAWQGLGLLPDAPIEGLKLVNFSSQKENVWGDGVASHTADHNPSTAWVSRDGQLPQTLIFELPVRSVISEISFNNPAYGDANRAARDVEISVSGQSATSGFDVAAKASLAQNEIGQGVRLNSNPVGRWIKVRVLSNYGNAEATSLGDVSVMGKPQPN